MNLPKSPSFDLSNKTTLVTGASRGIGLACATALAQHNAKVTLVARSKDELEKISTKFTKNNLKVSTKVLDVTDYKNVENWFAELTEPFDILVNNAGTGRNQLATNTSQEDYDLVMNLNVKATWVLANECAKKLIAAKKPGSIINMSSQMGHVSWVDRALYSASKHAVEGFTKGMAIEWGKYNIRVNTICPTFIETELTQAKLSDPNFRQAVIEKIPLGRVGTVEDIMGTVVFLASDAASLISGSAILVDGGWTAS